VRRRGQHKPHGHVGRVFGEHIGRIGDGDAFLGRSRHVDVVDAIAEIGDQLEARAGLLDQRGIDAVGDGRHQNGCLPHRGRQFLAGHAVVVEVQPRVEQLAHACFHRVGELAGDDDQRLFAAGHAFLERGR
jgi:hypothetical protein